MSVEKSVKHIWDFGNSLSAKNNLNRLLKSYYINTCRSILKKNSPYSSEMCTYCSRFWSENEFDLKLRPQAKSTNNTRSRKLIAKFEQAQHSQAKGLLTQKQRRRAKWLKKRSQSQLIISCKFCGHNSRQTLQKPKKTQKLGTEGEAETNVDEVEIVKPKNKKRKYKDKTAGLKIETGNNNQVKKAEPRSAGKTQKVQKNRSDTKAKNQPKVKPLAISKTQQQNKLLQLAELLKNQNMNKNSSQNRLNALIK